MRISKIPHISPSQWLSYVKRTNLDFGSEELLDIWKADYIDPAYTKYNIQHYIDVLTNIFDEVFFTDAVVVYRGLPLGWDGDMKKYYLDNIKNIDFKNWIRNPVDPRTKKIGLSWTWDERKAINDDHARGPTNIVLRSEIKSSDVDWLYTFSLSAYHGDEEKEIRLKPRRKIKITGIRLYNYSSNNYVGDWIDTNIIVPT